MEYSDGSAEAGVGLAVVLVWLLISLGILVWYLWAMARLFPRIGLKSTDGWIPIWNQWKLLDRTGLPGWLVLLSFVGLGIVPTILLIIAMYRLGKEYGAGVGYTVLGAIFAPLWATLFANVVTNSGRAHYAPAAPQQFGYAPAPQTAPQTSPQTPTAPAGYAPQASAPFAAPGQQYAPPAPPSPAVPSAPASPLGGETEAEYDRLATESFQAPPAAPFGQSAAPAPFSWTAARQEIENELTPKPAAAAVPPVHPLAVDGPAVPAVPAVPAAPAAPETPVTPPVAVAPPVAVTPPVPVTPPAPVTLPAPPTAAPAAHKPTGITGMHERLPESSTPQRTSQAETEQPAGPTANTDQETDLDTTVIVPRRVISSWVLELSDGTELTLSDDVVVGRKPEPIAGSAVLEVPDTTRTLSKSHVHLVRDDDRWLVEDLGSTNGLVLLNDDGTESEVPAYVRVEATERMLFGTLPVKLRRGGDSA